jgi:hypothetical protein
LKNGSLFKWQEDWNQKAWVPEMFFGPQLPADFSICTWKKPLHPERLLSEIGQAPSQVIGGFPESDGATLPSCRQL